MPGWRQQYEECRWSTLLNQNASTPTVNGGLGRGRGLLSAKEEARGQDGDLGKPRESVIVSVPVFVSASGSDPAFFPIPLALSLGVLDSGLRARRSGEHAELAVPEPDSAPDCAPLRVRGPSAGPPAIPGL